MNKPKSKTGWRDKCDRLWSTAIKLRDGGRCQRCGSRDKLTAHHILTKGSVMLHGRYNLDNGITLCFTCHGGGRFACRGSAHQDVEKFRRWIINDWKGGKGQDWYDNLFYETHQQKDFDYEETARILQEVINEYVQ